MPTYYMILTTAGFQAMTDSVLNGTAIVFSQLALGDSDTTPTEDQIALHHEVWRGNVNNVYRPEDYPAQVVVEAVVPPEDGPFWIKETGLFSSTGTLLACGLFPPTYKPALAEGSGQDIYVRLILIMDNRAIVTLEIDPSLTLATLEYVDDQAAILAAADAAHEIADPAHPAAKISFDNAVAQLAGDPDRVQSALEAIADWINSRPWAPQILDMSSPVLASGEPASVFADLDLASLIASGRTLAILDVEFSGASALYHFRVEMKAKGAANAQAVWAVSDLVEVETDVHNYRNQLLVPLDANRVCQYRLECIGTPGYITIWARGAF
ncbi:MAG: phage tail protein [Thermodesulfobacteriota bacterium]